MLIAQHISYPICITSASLATDALQLVDRANFVSHEDAAYAYDDRPLPIGHDVTISAPHMHALCVEQLLPQPHL